MTLLCSLECGYQSLDLEGAVLFYKLGDFEGDNIPAFRPSDVSQQIFSSACFLVRVADPGQIGKGPMN